MRYQVTVLALSLTACGAHTGLTVADAGEVDAAPPDDPEACHGLATEYLMSAELTTATDCGTPFDVNAWLPRTSARALIPNNFFAGPCTLDVIREPITGGSCELEEVYSCADDGHPDGTVEIHANFVLYNEGLRAGGIARVTFESAELTDGEFNTP